MMERKEMNVRIGERVKISREAAGLTQEKLAEYIDVSVQYISDLERGVVGSSVKTMIKLCNVLKVSSDYILLGKETPDTIPSDITNRMNRLDTAQQKILQDMINLTIRAFSTQ